MPALTTPTGEAAPRIAVRRLMMVAGVSLIPPAVLAVQAIRGGRLFVEVIVGSMVILLGLLAVRVADITAQAQRAADNESLLRRYAAELLR